MTSQTYIDFNQSVWWPPIFSWDESFAFDVHSISRIWNVYLTGAQTKFNHRNYWVFFVFHICFVKIVLFRTSCSLSTKNQNSIVSSFLFLFLFHTTFFRIISMENEEKKCQTFCWMGFFLLKQRHRLTKERTYSPCFGLFKANLSYCFHGFISVSQFLSFFWTRIFFLVFFQISSLAVVCAISDWVKNVSFEIFFMPRKSVHANEKISVWIIIIYCQKNVLRSNFD